MKRFIQLLKEKDIVFITPKAPPPTTTLTNDTKVHIDDINGKGITNNEITDMMFQHVDITKNKEDKPVLCLYGKVRVSDEKVKKIEFSMRSFKDITKETDNG